MRERVGLFITTDDNGSTVSDRVYKYGSYQEMLNDTAPGRYGIVDNIVYNRTNDTWSVGFPNVVNGDDCMAFEVMPNKVEIAAGTVDDVTGLSYGVAVAACTVHKMTICSDYAPEVNDIVIDWGDGTVEAINDGNHTYNGSTYELEHDYSEVMTSNIQRFIVKIYGKRYWAFRHNKYTTNNLMSRIFDLDLPVSRHLANFASTCFCANRLLSVYFYNYYHRILNINSMFCKCANLKSVKGFGTILNNENGVAGGTFEGCGELVDTDFRFPAGISTIGSTFPRCVKLAKDINDLLPVYGFENKTVVIQLTFLNCRALTGEGFGDKLWNDNTVNWIVKNSGTNYPFTGSSLKAIVPTTWGGTME